MAALEDCVALSLFPLSLRRLIGERLRSGCPADTLASSLLASGDANVHAAAARVPGILSEARRRGLTAVAWADAHYPVLLSAISDPPPLLWIRGHVSAFDAPAVAVVGSRAGSPYALAVAERLGGDLASLGVTVVSGLARGVDSAAHRGATTCGVSIAVLGSGADVIYPPEHRALAEEIAQAGAVVSELSPGTRPRKVFFPLRNRIISGLCRAVVVVEAGEKSGSLITARCALEQGRDVLAVPGNVLNGRNRGGHALLRDGARVVESARDVLEELGLTPVQLKPSLPDAASNPQAGARSTDPVLASLDPGEASDLEGIAERSGLPVSRLLPRLMELELAGLIARVGGGRFVRI
ncbi:MAG: DNA-processing protein DprA [Vicinamibacterales bacterium]